MTSINRTSNTFRSLWVYVLHKTTGAYLLISWTQHKMMEWMSQDMEQCSEKWCSRTAVDNTLNGTNCLIWVSLKKNHDVQVRSLRVAGIWPHSRCMGHTRCGCETMCQQSKESGRNVQQQSCPGRWHCWSGNASGMTSVNLWTLELWIRTFELVLSSWTIGSGEHLLT